MTEILGTVVLIGLLFLGTGSVYRVKVVTFCRIQFD